MQQQEPGCLVWRMECGKPLDVPLHSSGRDKPAEFPVWPVAPIAFPEHPVHQ